MINIIEQSKELTKVQKYLMTTSPAITILNKVADDTVIPVDAYMMFTDTKEDSEEVTELLSIITPNGDVYCCQSTTFKEYFADIASVADGEPFSIIKKSGTTKAGRTYIYCELDVTSLS